MYQSDLEVVLCGMLRSILLKKFVDYFSNSSRSKFLLQIPFALPAKAIYLVSCTTEWAPH